ncbi:TadE/TadG family type IV pilus assembly protein [Streptomyces sp. NPDC057067]|uniref:Pilus assembly protein n=2 Tax=Streptomyces TaxID=1883 RepID=A0A652KU87_9ACTN|nr:MULTISPECIES: TadE/TadG family type IV pilus assembly protein [Streptomyces]WSS70924.1 pilus assembly protein [Streptomyces sp. NBC_01175]WSS77940.1 pilus assembly protein [Streptomyces sp. NBC_01174]MBL1288570.1 pilus assembly protein [Streptomyces silvae]MDX3325910.1 TadE/TadG family type IV pilus assembly protein [Streptomyces sp. ME02-6979-3A]MDX3431691.1 TadE/TadG family type IV pilus assembly protein [Streptomyces sp. ME01-18a]
MAPVRTTRAAGRAADETAGRSPRAAGRAADEAAGRSPRAARQRARRRGDRGSTAIEYLGFLPVLILIGMAGLQLGLIAYTAQQAGTGARAAARTASQDGLRGSYERVGKASMTGWVAQRARIAPPSGGDSVTVKVTVTVPDVLLGLLGDRTVEKSATMPRD